MMKLKWLSVFAIMLMVGFVGCSSESSEEAPAESEEATEISDETIEVAQVVEETVEEVQEEHGHTHGDGDGAHSHGEAVSGISSKLTSVVDSVVSAITEQTVEAGCASCTYKMEGVEGCELAVKIGDTPHLVKGTDIDTHAVGLCTATQDAKIEGELMKDGTISASNFSLVQ